MIDSAGDAWTLVGRVRAFMNGAWGYPLDVRSHTRGAPLNLPRGVPPLSPFTALQLALMDDPNTDPKLIAAADSIYQWWDGGPWDTDGTRHALYTPNPADPFEDLPLRPAPDTLPSSPSGVTRPFITAHQQAAWWVDRRRSDNSPEARRNARAWGALRDAAEVPAADELRRVVGSLNQLELTHTPSTPRTGVNSWR